MGPAPGVSSVEVRGFVAWISSSVACVLYMLWAYTPDAVLEAHGITYYPAKYWAVALPAWVSVTVVFVFWAYESLCMMLIPPGGAEVAPQWDAASCRGKEAAGMASYFSSAAGAGGGIPPLVDVPPQLVSMVLQGGLSPREAERRYDRSIAAVAAATAAGQRHEANIVINE